MGTPETLKGKVIQEITSLREQKRHPQIRSDIDVVWIFSGAGTAKRPLEDNEPTWQRYRDSHRDRYATTLTLLITALKLNKDPREITIQEVLDHGPILFYNGWGSKNKDFEEWLSQSRCKIPKEKVRVVDTVIEEGNEIEIRHTLDQVKSFPSDLLDEEGEIKRIALVSHAEHFPRIWRYLEKHFPKKNRVEFYPYPVKIQAGWIEEFARIESEKVVEYYQKGDLAFDPIPHDL